MVLLKTGLGETLLPSPRLGLLAGFILHGLLAKATLTSLPRGLIQKEAHNIAAGFPHQANQQGRPRQTTQFFGREVYKNVNSRRQRSLEAILEVADHIIPQNSPKWRINRWVNISCYCHTAEHYPAMKTNKLLLCQLTRMTLTNMA